VSFPKYENYQSTEEDWLGDIPQHWQLLRTKSIFRLVAEPAPKNNDEELLSVYSDIGVKPRRELEARGNKASTTDGYWLVKKGDIIVNKLLAWMGAIGLSEYDGVTSPAYDILRAYKPINSKFYHYLFRNPICINKLKKHSKGIMEMRLRLYFDEFGNIKIPYPPLEDQNRIVEFLDRKTAEIDQAIEQKQRLIKLLKEQKAILIDRAVTKGLNPNVPMRDSGVEWIGEIPAHWEIKRLKHFSSTQSGITLGKTYTGKKLIDYPYLRVANIQYGYFNLDDVATLSLPQRETVRYFVKPGDILVTEGGDIDKLGRGTVWEGQINNCLHQNHVFAVRLNKSIGLEYFVAIYMACDYGRKYFIDTAIKTTNLASTNRTKLGNLPVILPPLDEQQQIIKYSKTIDNQFDNVLSTIMNELNNMNEIRQIIIANAVTGKIKI
jgi:type I restriction enzyme, S subunit